MATEFLLPWSPDHYSLLIDQRRRSTDEVTPVPSAPLNSAEIKHDGMAALCTAKELDWLTILNNI